MKDSQAASNLPRADENADRADRVLVTGATGYIGGRLIPLLLAKGYRLRVLARDPARLAGRPWLGRVEVAQGDVLDRASLAEAMEDVDVAYYLIHSMQGHSDFSQRDEEAASGFGTAAEEAGVRRIIYLGGLGDPSTDLSPHLRSRHKTGEALARGGVPVTEFRAAVIVGSGSASFEMIRHLTERIPVMVCPKWVYTRVQPIAIRDVLRYLVSALETPASAGRVVEIGGKDVLTYGGMLLAYASERGLKRWLVPVPVLTPRLSSYWVHWMTPIPSGIARPLIQGLRNEVVVRNPVARSLFPQLDPLSYREALVDALAGLQEGRTETSWSDALASSGRRTPSVVLRAEEGMIMEQRQTPVEASPEHVFRVFSALGGDQGWLYADWAWRLRGGVDRLLGGVGFRRGRRDREEVRQGDAVDFWRVEVVEQGRLLRLRAEMKVPGRAWLQFEVQPQESSEASDEATLDPQKSILRQTAYFAPRGLAGLLYWYALYPAHSQIFSGLIRKMAEQAQELEKAA